MTTTLWTVETDALPTNIMRIAAEIGISVGAGQGGRLGTMVTLERGPALRLKAELAEYGYTAWAERGVGG
jgi:hypothetical protein